MNTRTCGTAESLNSLASPARRRAPLGRLRRGLLLVNVWILVLPFSVLFGLRFYFFYVVLFALGFLRLITAWPPPTPVPHGCDDSPNTVCCNRTLVSNLIVPRDVTALHHKAKASCNHKLPVFVRLVFGVVHRRASVRRLRIRSSNMRLCLHYAILGTGLTPQREQQSTDGRTDGR